MVTKDCMVIVYIVFYVIVLFWSLYLLAVGGERYSVSASYHRSLEKTEPESRNPPDNWGYGDNSGGTSIDALSRTKSRFLFPERVALSDKNDGQSIQQRQYYSSDQHGTIRYYHYVPYRPTGAVALFKSLFEIGTAIILLTAKKRWRYQLWIYFRIGLGIYLLIWIIVTVLADRIFLHEWVAGSFIAMVFIIDVVLTIWFIRIVQREFMSQLDQDQAGAVLQLGQYPQGAIPGQGYQPGYQGQAYQPAYQGQAYQPAGYQGQVYQPAGYQGQGNQP